MSRLICPTDPMLHRAIFFPAFELGEEKFFQARAEPQVWVTYRVSQRPLYPTGLLVSEQRELSDDDLTLLRERPLRGGSMNADDTQMAWEVRHGHSMLSWGIGLDAEHRLGLPDPTQQRHEVGQVLQDGTVLFWRTSYDPAHGHQAHLHLPGEVVSFPLVHLGCLGELLDSPTCWALLGAAPGTGTGPGPDEVLAGQGRLIWAGGEKHLTLSLTALLRQRLWQLQQSYCPRRP